MDDDQRCFALNRNKRTRCRNQAMEELAGVPMCRMHVKEIERWGDQQRVQMIALHDGRDLFRERELSVVMVDGRWVARGVEDSVGPWLVPEPPPLQDLTAARFFADARRDASAWGRDGGWDRYNVVVGSTHVSIDKQGRGPWQVYVDAGHVEGEYDDASWMPDPLSPDEAESAAEAIKEAAMLARKWNVEAGD